jgi:nitrogen fixation/metabolism regulation signal transduction histidine kinase
VKPKQPKYISYLESIAEPLRNDVVSALSAKFLQLSETISKDMREVKAARAREEEAKRLSEMRQRRQR